MLMIQNGVQHICEPDPLCGVTLDSTARDGSAWLLPEYQYDGALGVPLCPECRELDKSRDRLGAIE